MILIQPSKLRTFKSIKSMLSCYSIVINKKYSINVENNSNELQIVKPTSNKYGNSRSSEIENFLKEKDIKYKHGYTSFICSCPRHVRRKLDIDEIDKLFINSVSG